MRILLASPHTYPAFGADGSGLNPRRYPSGSAFHLHDLLARGLAEEGHEVLYYLQGGTESPLPPMVTAAPDWDTDADIFHAPVAAHGFSDSTAEIARGRGRPALFTCHMKELNRNPTPNWVFVSRALAEAYGGGRVVLNGLDPDDLIYSESKQDYFLFIGSMHHALDKGLGFALEFARCRRLRLVVAGTGTDRTTVEQVSNLCRASNAQYLGDVRGKAKAELLANARAVLFPSRLHEGCPLVLIEALMSGTPVISSRCGGAAEVVCEETGFLCDSIDEWDLAIERIDRISSPRCREQAVKNFHYRRMVADYLAEYRKEIAAFRM